MSGQIAEFWASLGIKVDPKEIRKVDKFLKDTERRLKGGGKAKSQEAKASDQVVKAAKTEAQAKTAVARADAAATKTLDNKTRATQRLTRAEKERQRTESRGRISLLSPTRRVDTSVRDRINSMFPGINTPPIKYSSADRGQLRTAYRGLFDQASRRTTSAPKGTLGRGLPTREVPTQTLLDSMFPAMGRKPLGARSDDRRRLEGFYGDMLGRRPQPRNPLQSEIGALGRIGRNAPTFGSSGRVAEHLRKRRVEGEVGALGRIGVNRGPIQPVGSAMRRYDRSLEESVQQGRLSASNRRHERFEAGRREMMRANLGHLLVQGQQPRSHVSKEMRNHYRQEERQRKRISNEELKASQQGLQHEKEIERLRRQGNVGQRNANRQNRLTQATPRRHPQDLMRRTGANHASGNYLRAGGASGAFMRYGVGSLPFIGGAYGFSTLNRANQEAQITRLTTQAVLQGQGHTEQEGIEAFDWLRNLADDIGFSYMDSAQDYNQFLANSLGAGVDVQTSQGIFQGLSEYQTAMGTTSYRRKLINNALSQMMGKGVLSMEEVRRQMADSLPGTISLFSEAYAELMDTGETGQAAQARFYQDIATGSIVSAEILPIFARLASERAAPKLGVMKTMSVAEQGRFGSALSDLMLTASGSGVEEGFANFWRNATEMLRGAEPIVRGLSGAFEHLMWSMKPFTSIFTDVNNALASFSEYTGIAEGSVTKIGLWAAAMLTPWGRLAGAMVAVAMVMEDISWGVQGRGSSVTGDFFDALEGWGLELDTFEKTVMGVAAAFSTLYAAIKAVQGLGKAGGLLGGKKPPVTTAPTGGGRTPAPIPAGGSSQKGWKAPTGPRAPLLQRMGAVPRHPLAMVAAMVGTALVGDRALDATGEYLPMLDLAMRGPDSIKGIEWILGEFLEGLSFRPQSMDELNLMMRELGGDVLPFDPEFVPRDIRRREANWGTPLIFKPEEYPNYSNEVNGAHTQPPFRVGERVLNGNVEHNVNLDVNVSLDIDDMDSFRRFAEDEIGPIIGSSIERTLLEFTIGE